MLTAHSLLPASSAQKRPSGSSTQHYLTPTPLLAAEPAHGTTGPNPPTSTAGTFAPPQSKTTAGICSSPDPHPRPTGAYPAIYPPICTTSMALYNFHGGCSGCIQQEHNGSDFCFDCCYFEANWSKPNLHKPAPSKEELRLDRITTERNRIKLFRQQPPLPANAIKTSDRVQQLLRLPISQAPIPVVQLIRFLSKKYGACGEMYAAAYKTYAIVCEQTEGGICDEESRHFLTAITTDAEQTP